MTICLLSTLPLLAQTNTGELRVRVTDPDGLAVKASVELSSDATQFRRSWMTDGAGVLNARNLPFGLYRLQVQHEGFAPFRL